LHVRTKITYVQERTLVYFGRYYIGNHNVNGLIMSKNEFNHRQALAMGGGLMTGLGLGFFLLQTMGGLAFVGSIIGGIGIGLLLSVIIK
ncbi:MAG: hypothetical protein L7U67_05570, partial [Schleiferiaceae bacterium]|nr:hypothetical protein [Schleiferiaceae bacterium]